MADLLTAIQQKFRTGSQQITVHEFFSNHVLVTPTNTQRKTSKTYQNVKRLLRQISVVFNLSDR